MNTTKKVAPLTATLITIGSLAGGAMAQTITNGSLTGPTGASLVPFGWSSKNSPNTIDVNSDASIRGTNYLVNPTSSNDGGTWVGMIRNSNGFVESIYQTASFTSGETYSLSWEVANFGTTASSGNPDFDASGYIQLLIDDVVVYSGTPMGLSSNWHDEQFQFTASSNQHKIEFQPVSTGRAYLSIDGISATAVPEPSNTALLGLGSILLLLRRRK